MRAKERDREKHKTDTERETGREKTKIEKQRDSGTGKASTHRAPVDTICPDSTEYIAMTQNHNDNK